MASLLKSIERVVVGKLTTHPSNARQGDIGAISESLEANAQYAPLIVQRSTGHILAGNHTYKAAVALGWKEIDVAYVDVDDDKALRVLLSANRTADLAAYDNAALTELLQELAATPQGFTGTGYDGDALDELLADLKPKPVLNPEVVTEPPGEPITKPGDLWELGEHRLLCGDATKPEDYAIVGDGGFPDLVITDPPYGVAIGDKNAMLNAHGRGNRHEGALASDTGIAEVEQLWRAVFPQIRDAMRPGCPFYIFGPQGGDLGLLLLLLRESGIPARHMLIWVKDRPTFSLGRLDYEYAHEPIAYGWKAGAAHPWYGEGQQSSVIEEPRPSESKLHPTMKPVPLIERLIVNSSKAAGTILDPFGGSGTTLVACEQTGRIARLMEIDPGYCDVICRRYQNLTGTKPVRDGEPVDFLT